MQSLAGLVFGQPKPFGFEPCSVVTVRDPPKRWRSCLASRRRLQVAAAEDRNGETVGEAWNAAKEMRGRGGVSLAG